MRYKCWQIYHVGGFSGFKTRILLSFSSQGNIGYYEMMTMEENLKGKKKKLGQGNKSPVMIYLQRIIGQWSDIWNSQHFIFIRHISSLFFLFHFFWKVHNEIIVLL